MDKVVILVDGGYFGYLDNYLQSKRQKKIDLEEFSRKICNGKNLIRTKYYNAYPYKNRGNPTPEQTQKYTNANDFFNAINKKPHHEFVKVGRVKATSFRCPKCGVIWAPKQKGVDVAIALDLVKMSQLKVADFFVLVAGDEDFAGAVEMAKTNLVNVLVYCCKDPSANLGCSKKLMDVADDRVVMDLDFLEECAMDNEH